MRYGKTVKAYKMAISSLMNGETVTMVAPNYMATFNGWFSLILYTSVLLRRPDLIRYIPGMMN